ncbi:(Fe-S)-binding protein [Arcanobacterium canis]|uniref:(Fe-S)-binding protein n=1 Tax=Arcanobacterium canis TaxID=999183 RepID=A0ABY8G2F1_9ACTO|nr:(Fe-S)-binding protein [Arcanobacterium canis]WFM83984.1 (Fe-S)-binding protein [Arcanobacterium canis]
MKVALFATCIGDAMFPQAPQATLQLLTRLGIDVVVPPSQACCGQMHVNTGYYPEAMPLIENHVRTYEPVLDGEWDAIVVPSGSCTGSIRHQQKLVADAQGHPELGTKAQAIANKTYELSEFLVDVLGTDDVGAYFAHRVTYHPTCHSLRVARVGDKPERLLRNVRGIDFVELPHGDSCCGFGGTFSLKNPDTSASMLADKMTNIKSTGADVLVAGDYSCLMHIAGGLARNRAGIRAMHLAEVLAGTEDQPWIPAASTVKVGA